MSEEWDGKPMEDLLSQDATVWEEGMSVWTFLEDMSAGRLLSVTSAEAFSLALDEVFLEIYHSVLKRVSCAVSLEPIWLLPWHFCLSLFFNWSLVLQGYMWKKGHVRRNWTERWFVLKPSSMAYYVSEDLKDKRGEIQLDQNCVIEVSEENSACLTLHQPTLWLTHIFLFQSIPDREGKRCLFCVKTHSKTYEMSAPDQKQKVEWTQGV